MVNHVDYLVNDSVKIKNYQVLDVFITDYLPDLERNLLWFTNLKEKIKKLQKESYNVDGDGIDNETLNLK